MLAALSTVFADNSGSEGHTLVRGWCEIAHVRYLDHELTSDAGARHEFEFVPTALPAVDDDLMQLPHLSFLASGPGDSFAYQRYLYVVFICFARMRVVSSRGVCARCEGNCLLELVTVDFCQNGHHIGANLLRREDGIHGHAGECSGIGLAGNN